MISSRCLLCFETRQVARCYACWWCCTQTRHMPVCADQDAGARIQEEHASRWRLTRTIQGHHHRRHTCVSWRASFQSILVPTSHRCLSLGQSLACAVPYTAHPWLPRIAPPVSRSLLIVSLGASISIVTCTLSPLLHSVFLVLFDDTRNCVACTVVGHCGMQTRNAVLCTLLALLS